MSKARELASLGNAYSDGALSNRNLIINGKHAINQRGQLPVSMITGYNCTDRWKTYTNTSVSNSLSEVTLPNGDTVNALKGVSNATTTAVISFYQVVENDNYRAFAGQTMTASCWVRSNNTNARLFMWGNSSNVGSVTHSGNGQWEKLTVTFTLPSSPVQLELYAAIGDNGSLSAVSVLSGDYVEFTEVQLEVGDTATPFEHRSIGQELALCQRYYEMFTFNANFGALHSSNALSNTIAFSQIKRTNPSVSVTDSYAPYTANRVNKWFEGSIERVVNITFITSRGAALNTSDSSLAGFTGSGIMTADAEL